MDAAIAGVPLNKAHRFAHIDAMRALAVLLVVFAHAGFGSIVPGGSGVTIFFAISGFIISFLVLRERDRTHNFLVGRFYFRRAIKLFPPLLLIIVLPTLIYSLFAKIDWFALFSQVAFFFNWFKANGGADVLPGSGVVWSLAIEEQFYLAFALIWLLSYRSKHYHTILAAVAVLAICISMGLRIAITASDIPDAATRIYYSTDTRLDSIAWGVLTAVLFHLWESKGSRPNWMSRVLGAPATLIFAIALYLASILLRDETFRDTLRFSIQSIAACLLLVYGLMPSTGWVKRVFYRISTFPVIAAIGLASYSIYLVHLPLMSFLFPITNVVPYWAAAPLLAIVGIGAGWLIYRAIEVPVLRLRGVIEARYEQRKHRAATR